MLTTTNYIPVISASWKVLCSFVMFNILIDRIVHNYTDIFTVFKDLYAIKCVQKYALLVGVQLCLSLTISKTAIFAASHKHNVDRINVNFKIRKCPLAQPRETILHFTR